MTKSRVTVHIDDELQKKLRSIQAKLIDDTQSWHSFSDVINGILHDYCYSKKTKTHS